MPLKDLARRNLVAMRTHLNRYPGDELSKTKQKRLVNLCLLQQERIEELEILAIKNAEAIRQDALDLGAWGRRWFNAKRVGRAIIADYETLMRYVARGINLPDGYSDGARENLARWEGVDDVV